MSKAFLRGFLLFMLIVMMSVAGVAQSFVLDLPDQSQRAEISQKIGITNITIKYHGHPNEGLIFAKDRDGNPSATGDNWPNRVHYWIPSLDHPSAKRAGSMRQARSRWGTASEKRPAAMSAAPRL